MKKLYLFQRIYLALASLVTLGLGIYQAFNGAIGAAATCLSAGIVLFLLGNLELFESIKAGSIQATMRKIDEKVDHVERLAEKVAKTSTVTAEFCMEVMSRVGRMSGPIPRAVSLKLVRDMSQQLLSLDVEKTKVDELLQPWRSMVAFDLLRPARQAMETAVRKVQQDIEQTYKELPLPLNSTSAEYLECERKLGEINAWRNRLSEMWKGNGWEHIQLLQAIYKELSEKYGGSIFGEHDSIEESIRQGHYFVIHKEFLNEKYWTEGGHSSR